MIYYLNSDKKSNLIKNIFLSFLVVLSFMYQFSLLEPATLPCGPSRCFKDELKQSIDNIYNLERCEFISEEEMNYEKKNRKDGDNI